MEKLRITVNGRSYDVTVEVLGTDEAGSGSIEAALPAGQPLTAINGGKAPAPPLKGPAETPGARALRSPMPGTVLEIRVKPGDSVKSGQVLLTLEAMKMENELVAESDGRVKEIHVARGQSVQAGETLISLA